ncbi:hypothetical protein Rs2_05001 [Raphanus sativus]|nr:hypothetical protein Rs2_05001 [Raphanus sativus]
MLHLAQANITSVMCFTRSRPKAPQQGLASWKRTIIPRSTRRQAPLKLHNHSSSSSLGIKVPFLATTSGNSAAMRATWDALNSSSVEIMWLLGFDSCGYLAWDRAVTRLGCMRLLGFSCGEEFKALLVGEDPICSAMISPHHLCSATRLLLGMSLHSTRLSKVHLFIFAQARVTGRVTSSRDDFLVNSPSKSSTRVLGTSSPINSPRKVLLAFV